MGNNLTDPDYKEELLNETISTRKVTESILWALVCELDDIVDVLTKAATSDNKTADETASDLPISKFVAAIDSIAQVGWRHHQTLQQILRDLPRRPHSYSTDAVNIVAGDKIEDVIEYAMQQVYLCYVQHQQNRAKKLKEYIERKYLP